MIKLIRKLFGHLQFHSMKLAAAASAALVAFIQFVSAKPELMLGIVAFMPSDPVTRFVFAAACGLLVYFSVDIARFWPQPKLEDKKENEQ